MNKSNGLKCILMVGGVHWNTDWITNPEYLHISDYIILSGVNSHNHIVLVFKGFYSFSVNIAYQANFSILKVASFYCFNLYLGPEILELTQQ